MPSRTALAATMLALPGAAVAFGDLDCIGTEVCSDTGCNQSFMAYGIEFDWANQSVSVDVGGRPETMRLAGNDLDADGAQGTLTYFNQTSGLVIDFDSAEILMFLSDGTEGLNHRAVCAQRQDA